MVHEREDRRSKFRNFGSLLAIIGPIVMVAGLIGTWHLSQYRLSQLEQRLKTAEERLAVYREGQLRHEAKIDDFAPRLNSCCPYGNGGRWRMRSRIPDGE